ncbi:MAG: DUF1330 domain-containing protein [Paracoccaceae bacterium]
MHDAETYKQYTDRTPPIFKKYGGKFLNRDTAGSRSVSASDNIWC